MNYTLSLTVALSVLSGTGMAVAEAQRHCTTAFAVFPSGNQEDVAFALTVTAADSAARVAVAGSGEWSARRRPEGNGAETITFDTDAADETLTIGAGGELLWQIDYKDSHANSDRVIAFVGMCDPWRGQ